MKPHARLRALSAMAGGCAVVGIGLFGLSVGSPTVASGPDTVLAPATGTVKEVTTTSTAPSFRPLVTATIAPPPSH